jgi:hypothetical protein
MEPSQGQVAAPAVPAEVRQDSPEFPTVLSDRIAILLLIVGAPLVMLLWLAGIIWLLTLVL